jgi:cell division protein FtsI (penicillin-binding protein 3)
MYRNDKPVNWAAVRIAFVAVLFAAGTVLLLVRAYRLQVVDAETLRKRAEKQRTKVISLEARRGTIYDRNGDQLAASLEVNSVYARPRKMGNKKAIAKKLAELLEMEEKEVLGKLDEEKGFVWLRRRVSPAMAEKVKDADLPGVFDAKEYQRFYPLKNLAAHAVGFAGLDSKGLEGLELFYDKDLKSEPIPVTAQRDALGRPVMFAAIERNPTRRDLHLTLDRNIQYVAEKELEDGVRRASAKGGVAIILDVDSGEIRGMAVQPTYNLNVFHRVPADVRRNRSVADAFEPGSTLKVFLAAAALDLGKVAPDEQFFCHEGLYRYNGALIHDIAPYKNLSFTEILVRSSNIGAVKVSEKLTKGDFFRVLNGFGFGVPSCVDLPGERPGVLLVPAKWSVLTKANIAFGQGITVNPLQLATAFAALVNGGNLYRPHLLKRLTDGTGEVIRETPVTFVRRVIQPATSEHLVEILREVVQRGTGKAGAIAGADAIGKTGTAQKADPNGGYSKDKYVSSFLGALMSTKPRMVIFVMLDEPGVKERTGGQVAAPVFRRIGEGILAQCGSKPTDTDNTTLQASAAGPWAAKAGGEKAIRISVRRGSRPGEWIVPDLKGLDMRSVVEVCGKIKCDPSFRGTGLAVGQDPKPGHILKEGAPLTVSFEGQAS